MPNLDAIDEKTDRMYKGFWCDSLNIYGRQILWEIQFVVRLCAVQYMTEKDEGERRYEVIAL